MAKPFKIKGLKASQPVREAAGLILRAKLAEVFSYEDLVRAGDVDGVHDMRVGMKRFREALRLLRPVLPKAEAKQHMAWVEELNDALGAVRDPDVMSEGLAALAQEADLGPALEPLQQELAQRRSRRHDALVGRLDAIRKEKLQRKCGRFIDRLAAHRSRRHRETARRFAHQAIADRLMRAFALEEAARAPGAVEAFHRMRIAVKRLKYALEPFLGILPRIAKQSYGSVSDLQELMGQVHDCDVLEAAVSDFAAAGDGARRTAAERAIEALHKRRQELYDATLVLLDTMAEQDFSRRLLDGLD